MEDDRPSQQAAESRPAKAVATPSRVNHEDLAELKASVAARRELVRQHDPRHDVIVILDLSVLAVNGSTKLAETDLGALGDRSDLSNPDCGAALGGEYGVLNVAHRLDLSNGPHVDLLETRDGRKREDVRLQRRVPARLRGARHPVR